MSMFDASKPSETARNALARFRQTPTDPAASEALAAAIEALADLCDQQAEAIASLEWRVSDASEGIEQIGSDLRRHSRYRLPDGYDPPGL